MISFIVYGEPVAQSRAGRRNFIKNNKVHSHSFDPEKSASFKDKVYDCAVSVKPEKPFDGAVIMSLLMYRSIPKSFSKKRHELALSGDIRPTTKPDIDNIIKGVKDALRGVIWLDDSQVVGYGRIGKYYSDTPRVEIEIREL